jgi:dihydrofolate synthase / folylpolyglutamate synthase
MNIEKKLTNLAKRAGIHYSLSHLEEALSLLDNPQQANKYIHIAGTNGKGTTADFIAQNLELLGFKVGLYTSPHLFSYTERIKINNEPIKLQTLCNYLRKIKKIIKNFQLTEFEILTIISFLYFNDNKVDYVILETGLGGRLDATNVIIPIVSIITTISYDHQSILGNSLSQIASEKAGIIKNNIPVITFSQEPPVNSILQKKAKETSSPIYFIQKKFDNYLNNNKLLAEKAMLLLGYEFKSNLSTRLLGRMQLIQTHPPLIADSAHNIEGVLELKNYIKKSNLETDIIVSFSNKPKEDIIKILLELSSVAKNLIITNFNHYKALPASNIKEIAKDVPNIQIIPMRKISQYVAGRKRSLIVTGSIYFLGYMLQKKYDTTSVFAKNIIQPKKLFQEIWNK